MSALHPAAHLGERAVEAMDRTLSCASNAAVGSKKVMALLLKHGLLQEAGERVILKDRFGTVTAMTYQAPPDVMERWTAYWLEQPECKTA